MKKAAHLAWTVVVPGTGVLSAGSFVVAMIDWIGRAQTVQSVSFGIFPNLHPVVYVLIGLFFAILSFKLKDVQDAYMTGVSNFSTAATSTEQSNAVRAVAIGGDVGDNVNITTGDTHNYFTKTDEDPLKILRERFPDMRRITAATSDEIRSIFRENLTIHAEKLISGYIGTAIVVEGYVQDVSPRKLRDGTSYYFVSAKDIRDEVSMLFMTFDSESFDELNTAKKGYRLRAIGAITGASKYEVSLDPCKLILLQDPDRRS